MSWEFQPGLAVELFKSVPYGKRAILVAKQSNVDELFQKVPGWMAGGFLVGFL
jgi:hypothetical protein